MDLEGRTLRGGAVTIGAQFVKYLLLLVTTVVLARLLTPDDMGLFAMVFVVIVFVGVLTEQGLSTAIIQYPELNQRQVSALFWINFALSAGLMVLTAALAPAIAWFYGEPRLVAMTVAISSTFLLSSITLTHQALLKRQMRFTSLAVVDIVSSSIETAVGIAAAMAGWGYWSLVLMKLVAAPVQALLTLLMCPWRPGRPARLSEVRSMLAFGGHLTGFNVAIYLARNLDNLLLGRFYGPQQLGLYNRAYTLLLLPLHGIWGPVSAVAVPTLSRLVDSPEDYRQTYASIAGKVGLLTMPLVAFLVGTSDWFLLVLLGPQWVEASTIFRWLGVSGLIESFAASTLWLYTSQGRTHQQLRWGLINAVIFGSAICAGLHWGPLGVATAYGLVGLCVRTPLMLWFVGREGPVRTRDLYQILAPFAVSVCATLLVIVGFRRWVGEIEPLMGLVVAGGLTIVTTVLALTILPSGRLVIRDMQKIPLLLFKREVTA